MTSSPRASGLVDAEVEAWSTVPALRLTTCGLLGAVLVTVKVAVSEPEFWRYQVTVALQLAPGATSPQLLVCWYLPLEIEACREAGIAVFDVALKLMRRL